MIRRGFLDSESRRDLIELARAMCSAAHRLARRANALVLLDKGHELSVGCRGAAASTTTRSGLGINSIGKTGSRVWRASAMKEARLPADGGATRQTESLDRR